MGSGSAGAGAGVEPADPEGVGPSTTVVVTTVPVKNQDRDLVFHKPGDGGGPACCLKLDEARVVARREVPQARACLLCWDRAGGRECPFCGEDVTFNLAQHLTGCSAVPAHFREAGSGGG